MVKIHEPERSVPLGQPGASFDLGQRVFGQPLAMLPARAEAIADAIADKMFDARTVDASKFVGSFDRSKAVNITDDGIALVSVAGMLIDRGAFLGPFWGMLTSYEGLEEQFRKLGEDSAVKAVVLDIDSGGGMVAGIWDLCAEIDLLKEKKPVYAVAANMACSAAYAIACCAKEVHVTRSGEVGSIGVVMVHRSAQRALDAAGFDVTILSSGDRKTDGNPWQQLSPGARKVMAQTIDSSFDEFVSHVAKHRAGLEADDIRAMEAGCFRGQAAVNAKLADGVSTVRQLTMKISAELKAEKPKASAKDAPAAKSAESATRKPKGKSMSHDTESGRPEAAAQFDIDLEAATKAAVETALADERTRRAAILKAPGAEVAPTLASHLVDAGVVAAAATEILAAAAADLESAVAAQAAAQEEATADAPSGGAAALGNALQREMTKHAPKLGLDASEEATKPKTGMLANVVKAKFGGRAGARRPENKNR